MVAGAHADSGDMGFERHPPQARVADQLVVLTQHDVRSLPVLRQLTGIRVLRPRRGEHLPLYCLNGGDVLKAHRLERETRDDLHVDPEMGWLLRLCIITAPSREGRAARAGD